MSNFKKNISHRKGLTLIEAASVLGLLAIMFGGFTQMAGSANEQLLARSASDRLREVTDASERYLQAHAAALRSATTVDGSPIAINITGASYSADLPSVQGTGLLLPEYSDVNSYGQKHILLVKQVSNAVTGVPILEGLVTTTGGRTMSDASAGMAASLAGAQAGIVYTKAPSGASTNSVYGVRGGWKISNKSTWTAGSVSPTSGHISALVGLNDTQISGPYLARLDVGDVTQNTMYVDLHMGANNIVGANTITADSSLAYLTIGSTMYVQGDVISTGNVTGNDLTANNSLNVLGNASIAGDANVGGNMMAGTVTATSGDVVAYQNVIAQTGYMQSSRYNSNDGSYYMEPANDTYLNKLYTKEISLDTIVFGPSGSTDATGQRTISESSGYRLGDLLPKYVLQGGWIASNDTSSGTDQTVVPKPYCGTSASAQAKIFLTPMSDSMQFLTGDKLIGKWTNNWLYAAVSNAIPTNSYDSGYTIGQAKVPYLTYEFDQDALTYLYRTFSAVDTTGNWIVKLNGTSPDTTKPWYVFATTYCYYP